MTVAELITHLQCFDGREDVKINSCYNDIYCDESIETVEISKDKKSVIIKGVDSP